MKRAIKVVGILLAGVMLGAGMSSSGGDVQAAEKVITKDRIVTKEVPGPVQIKTETKTVTVEKTPASCIAALKAAEDGFDVASQGFALTSELPGLIGQAYKAGLTGNVGMIDQVIETMKRNTAQTKSLTPRLQTAGVQFNTAKAACRSAR